MKAISNLQGWEWLTDSPTFQATVKANCTKVCESVVMRGKGFTVMAMLSTDGRYLLTCKRPRQPEQFDFVTL